MQAAGKIQSSSKSLKLYCSAVNNYITGISIWDDFNASRGFDVLNTIYEDSNGIPLHIFCNKEELLSGMKDNTLNGNIYYWCTEGVGTFREANEIMERVYDYEC